MHSLVSKLDFRLLPHLFLLYLFASLDRTNIGYAKALGLEKDLQLTSGQYSAAIAIFYVGYILFSLPSNIMLRRTSPRFWLCFIMVVWGSIVLLMTWCETSTQLIVGRFLLGVFEAG